MGIGWQGSRRSLGAEMAGKLLAGAKGANLQQSSGPASCEEAYSELITTLPYQNLGINIGRNSFANRSGLVPVQSPDP